VKHKVKVDVVTEKPGFFGKRQVVERKTITVNGREYRKLKQKQFRKEQENRELTEQQRLAALYLLWEEEMADYFEE
jgi:hypothetical protein